MGRLEPDEYWYGCEECGNDTRTFQSRRGGRFCSEKCAAAFYGTDDGEFDDYELDNSVDEG